MPKRAASKRKPKRSKISKISKRKPRRYNTKNPREKGGMQGKFDFVRVRAGQDFPQTPEDRKYQESLAREREPARLAKISARKKAEKKLEEDEKKQLDEFYRTGTPPTKDDLVLLRKVEARELAKARVEEKAVRDTEEISAKAARDRNQAERDEYDADEHNRFLGYKVPWISPRQTHDPKAPWWVRWDPRFDPASGAKSKSKKLSKKQKKTKRAPKKR